MTTNFNKNSLSYKHKLSSKIKKASTETKGKRSETN